MVVDSEDLWINFLHKFQQSSAVREYPVDTTGGCEYEIWSSALGADVKRIWIHIVAILGYTQINQCVPILPEVNKFTLVQL